MTPSTAYGLFFLSMLTLLVLFGFTSVKVDANEIQVMLGFGTVLGGALKVLVKKQ